MRDYRKLNVFTLADELVADVYVATRRFPPEERIGLQAQLRKAAVMVPASIVVGCERASESEYIHYSGVALASASEARYLLSVASRLGYLAEEGVRELEERYGRLVGGLNKLIRATREGKRSDKGDGQRRYERRDAPGNRTRTSDSRSSEPYPKRRDERSFDPLDD